MPQGKKWGSEKCEALSKARINCSEDNGSANVKVTHQSGDDFLKKVVMTLRSLAPTDHSERAGRYHNRELKSIKSHWNEKLCRDV
jgi:hypothetical protein